MAGILFLVLFFYTFVRLLKDTLILTAPGSGGEVVSYLKFGCVLPSAMLFVVLYAKMSNMFNKTTLYYVTLLPFIAFFVLFGFILYPMRDALNMDLDTINAWKAAYPHFRWAVPIFAYWIYSLFYVFAEIFGNVGVMILFWQFANNITDTKEASRFYPLFGFFANLSLIFVETVTKALFPAEGAKDSIDASATVVDKFSQSLPYAMLIVLVCGLGIMLLHYYIVNIAMKDTRLIPHVKAPKKQDKPKMSLLESFKYLLKSKYLGFIVLIVLGYNISINLVEVTFKSQLSAAYTKSEVVHFMASMYGYTGIVTMLITFTCKGVMRSFGWTFTALITPVVLLITGGAFYAFILFQSNLDWVCALAGASPAFLAIIFGAAQNVSSKSTKYAFFDSSINMAYIPAGEEEKIKGKAAVDVLGGRLGKSSGGLIQLVLLTLIPEATQMTIAPILAVLMVFMILVWLWSVKGLSGMYHDLLNEKEPDGLK